MTGRGAVRLTILGRDRLEEHLAAVVALDGEIEGVEPWRREHFLLDLPGKWECSLLACDEEGPLAFKINSIKGETMHGHRVAVRRTHRRRGVGRLLYALSAQLALERGCGVLTGKVAVANRGVLDFHRRLGGRVYGLEGANALVIHDCAALAAQQSRSTSV